MIRIIDIILLISCVLFAGCMKSPEKIYEFKETGCEDLYINISNTPEKDADINISQNNIYFLSVRGVSLETPGIKLQNSIKTKTIPGTSDSECMFFSRSAELYAIRYNRYVNNNLKYIRDKAR